jgi:hypothetical protein
VLAHAPRQPAAWLTCNVGQKETPMNDQVQILIAACWTFASAAAGWLAHRRFSDERDRRNRRIELLQHISGWRSQIERHSPGDSNGIFASYEGGVHKFNSHFHVVLADRPRDDILKSLGEKAASLNYPDFRYTDDGVDKRDIACQWLDKLREHLKNAKD